MVMWRRRRAEKSEDETRATVDLTLHDIRKAVLKYEDDMPEGITRTALITKDGSLDLTKLKRYLGVNTDQKFYLSRETFEIFSEEDRHIPYHLDRVQAALDDYVRDTGKLPILPESTDYEVDIRLLVSEHYLEEIPPIPFYVTEQEFMLTHRTKGEGGMIELDQ